VLIVEKNQYIVEKKKELFYGYIGILMIVWMVRSDKMTNKIMEDIEYQLIFGRFQKKEEKKEKKENNV